MTDMPGTLHYSVIRSNRRTCAIQLKNDGTVLVRAPMHMKNTDIDRFVCQKEGWIQRSLKQMQRAEETFCAVPPLTSEALQALSEEASCFFPERVRTFAERIGVTFGKVTIRCQKTRWGSCSAAGNLNFNCLLMLTPLQVCDYVIIHELCHRLEMNHSARFWAEVAYVMPDWRESHTWLKKNGAALLRRAESSEAIM